MTVSPQTCLLPCAKEIAQAAALTTAIDAFLQKNFDASTATVSYSLPARTGNRVLSIIIRQYETAGWKVQLLNYRNEIASLSFTQGTSASSIVVAANGTLQVIT